MNHFQTMARGHFTVRRLERAYGREPVREAYEREKAALASPDSPASGIAAERGMDGGGLAGQDAGRSNPGDAPLIGNWEMIGASRWRRRSAA